MTGPGGGGSDGGGTGPGRYVIPNRNGVASTAAILADIAARGGDIQDVTRRPIIDRPEFAALVGLVDSDPDRTLTCAQLSERFGLGVKTPLMWRRAGLLREVESGAKPLRFRAADVLCAAMAAAGES